MQFKALILVGAVALSLVAVRADDIRTAPRTYKIGPSTQIQIDGNDVPVAQLKPGLHALVSPDSFQDGYAASIDAHTLSAKGGAQIDGGARAQSTWVQKNGSWVQVPNAPQQVVSALAPPASSAKYWVITAVSADSITIQYK